MFLMSFTSTNLMILRGNAGDFWEYKGQKTDIAKVWKIVDLQKKINILIWGGWVDCRGQFCGVLGQHF